MNQLMHDFRYALRSLRHAPSFSIAAILTIAVSIGATASIFSVVHGILLDPLPYPEPSRLVIVWQTDAHNDSWSEGASGPDYVDWKRDARSFSQLGANSPREFNFLPAGGTPERIDGEAISHDYLEVLGVRPALGRAFTAEEDRVGGPPVAILSWNLWQERFGADPGALGRTIRLEGRDHTIVGVVGDLGAGEEAQVYVPAFPAWGEMGEMRGVHNVVVWGRLAPGVTIERAQEEMTSISQELERLYPDDNKGRGARIETVHDAIVGDVRKPVLVLFGAAIMVLLIGCANVAGLLVARGVARAREMSVRVSLGAGRARILRQLFVESITLALAGGIAGILLAIWGVRILVALAPESTPRIANVSLDPTVLSFALVLSLASGILFGILPALRLSRQAFANNLRGSDRGGAGTAAAPRQLLVVAEIAIAAILTIGAGLLLRSFWNLQQVEPGFRPAGLMTFDISLPEAKYPVPPRSDYPKWPAVTRFYDELLPALRATPGVESAAVAMNHPLRRGWTSRVVVEGAPPAEGPQDEQRIRAISPGYFETTGTTILRGRDVTAADTGESPFVVLINQAFADRYFPNEDPIGRRVVFWGTAREVIGIVANVRFMGPRNETDPAVYSPLTQTPQSNIAVVVRAGGNPLAHFGSIRTTLARLEPGVAPSNVRTLEQIRSESIGTERFQMVLLSLFGASALVLAAIGIFGLIAYQVEQRRREIGVRMALGADRQNVVRMIVGEGARLAIAGVAAGAAGALVVTRLLESLLFEVGSRDSLVYLGVVALLASIALAASWIPARRAGSVDPATVLRWE